MPKPHIDELKLFLKGVLTPHHHAFEVAFNSLDSFSQSIVKFYINGGSYKQAESIFGCSQAIFYHRIRKFFQSIDISIKILSNK